MGLCLGFVVWCVLGAFGDARELPGFSLRAFHVSWGWLSFLCARRSLCEPYFEVVRRTYETCGRSFSMPWPPQALYASTYRGNTLRLVAHAYTIARPGHDDSAGPECKRLACSSNSYSTGCVARHLPAHVSNARAMP